MIVSSPKFRDDPDLQQIDTVDILNVYDDYSRQLEKEHDDESRRYRTETARKARKAREGFNTLLSDMVEKGELTRLSKWKDTVKKIREEERYQALLGMPGSSPLDLWMDAVDDLGEETERAAEKIEKAIEGIGKQVRLETSKDDFEELVKEAHMDAQIELKLRREVYDLVGRARTRSRRCSSRDGVLTRTGTSPPSPGSSGRSPPCRAEEEA
jgi:pre-mRNA-processing factor 40